MGSLEVKLRGAFLVLLALLVPVLWVMNCSGPLPTVTRVRMIAPRTKGGAYQVDALVHNGGLGHGQVDVIFQLRNKATAQTIQQDSKVTLQSGQTAFVQVMIQAPPGTYTPTVEADYPPG